MYLLFDIKPCHLFMTPSVPSCSTITKRNNPTNNRERRGAQHTEVIIGACSECIGESSGELPPFAVSKRGQNRSSVSSPTGSNAANSVSFAESEVTCDSTARAINVTSLQSADVPLLRSYQCSSLPNLQCPLTRRQRRHFPARLESPSTSSRGPGRHSWTFDVNLAYT